MAEVEKDPLTGTDTTGHEWDGIKELDTPLPRWWVLTFWVTVVWAIAYTIAYPSWPTLSGYAHGLLGYSSRAQLGKEMAAVEKSRSVWVKRLEAASLEEIAKDDELRTYAIAGGRAIFADNCAPCHGAGGAGAKNFPVLADDDWLWGGTLKAIATTIRYGIRSTSDDTRSSQMPRFGVDGQLDKKQIAEVADYVVSLSEGGGGSAAGKAIFKQQCASCHGPDGKGNQEFGAPNLTDDIWLYGKGKEAVMRQVNNPRMGVMPSWENRLSDVSIKEVAVYVHSLGGGK